MWHNPGTQMMPQLEVGWQVFASAWWDKLDTIDPKFVYYPNAGKMWLVVKPERLQAAEMHFQGTGVEITVHVDRDTLQLGLPGCQESQDLS